MAGVQIGGCNLDEEQDCQYHIDNGENHLVRHRPDLIPRDNPSFLDCACDITVRKNGDGKTGGQDDHSRNKDG